MNSNEGRVVVCEREDSEREVWMNGETLGRVSVFSYLEVY